MTLRRTDPPSASWKASSTRVELLRLYAAADALLAPFSCDGTTECCQFAITNREPYPTAVELAEVEHAVRAMGGFAPRGRRKLPLAGESTRRCALLDDAGRCRIYASRPFGCRTYFCDRVVGPGKLPRAEIQALSRAIADLTSRFAPRDPGPRPLSRFLEGLAARRR